MKNFRSTGPHRIRVIRVALGGTSSHKVRVPGASRYESGTTVPVLRDTETTSISSMFERCSLRSDFLFERDMVFDTRVVLVVGTCDISDSVIERRLQVLRGRLIHHLLLLLLVLDISHSLRI